MNYLLKPFKNPAFMFLLGITLTMLLISALELTSANTIHSENTIYFNENNQNNPNILSPNVEQPLQTDSRDKATPTSFFKEEQIKVYKNQVILDAENIKWASFTDTKSMLPIINKDSYALQIEPVCEELQVGDIVSYNSKYASGIIIHRIIHKAEDTQGIYFILKGDNNPSSDPGKIRCDQIDRKVVAIIY